MVLLSFKLPLGCHVCSALLFLALTSGPPFHPFKKLCILHSLCVAVISCQFWLHIVCSHNWHVWKLRRSVETAAT